jgi:hypothetical protein
MRMERKRTNLQLVQLKKITKVILCAQLLFLQITKKLLLLNQIIFFSFTKLAMIGERKNQFATNSCKTVL